MRAALTRFPDDKEGRKWVVVGGAEKGGIRVRTGPSFGDPECRARLAQGAVVEELELAAERLHYRRISGSGPDYGWVSLAVGGKRLLRLRGEEVDEPANALAENAKKGSISGRDLDDCQRRLEEDEEEEDEEGTLAADMPDGLPVQLFNWQKGAYSTWDCADSLSFIESIVEPSDVYFVAASWNDWALDEMVQDRSAACCHFLDLRLPTNGGFFQIVLNRDWQQVLYPSCKRAGSEACEVMGPDGDYQGLSWALDGQAGDVLRLKLRQPPGAGGRWAVGWRRLRAAAQEEEAPAGLFRTRYFIVGSWTDWARKQSMPWTGERYEFAVELGGSGAESFQLLEEGNWKRRLHPDVRNANPHEPYKLVGPDAESATGLNWKIGQHPNDEAVPGARYVISLHADARGQCHVSWARQAAQPKADAQPGFWVAGCEAARKGKDVPVFASAPGLASLASRAEPPRLRVLRRIPGAFVLVDVLQPEECERLMAISERMGFSVDSSMAAGRDVRESETCTWLADAALNDSLFERCRPFMPPLVDGGKVAGLNRRWRLYRYPVAATFRPHVDGSWPGSGLDHSGKLLADAWGDRWSHLSCLLYLNDDFRGGATRFFLPHGQGGAGERPCRVEEVRPKCGSALFFFHGEHPMSPVHEGARVVAGTKYVLRTDVLYLLPTDRASGQNFWQERFAGVSKGF